jgi:hypothetical protein
MAGTGPLSGLRVVELEGIGPVPHALVVRPEGSLW